KAAKAILVPTLTLEVSNKGDDKAEVEGLQGPSGGREGGGAQKLFKGVRKEPQGVGAVPHPEAHGLVALSKTNVGHVEDGDRVRGEEAPLGQDLIYLAEVEEEEDDPYSNIMMLCNARRRRQRSTECRCWPAQGGEIDFSFFMSLVHQGR
ncbi:unnamed protein product, partial [Discosporangium mesarthrocarpum]